MTGNLSKNNHLHPLSRKLEINGSDDSENGWSTHSVNSISQLVKHIRLDQAHLLGGELDCQVLGRKTEPILNLNHLGLLKKSMKTKFS